MKQETPTCIICGRKSDMLGMFIPNQPEMYGGTRGKSRTFYYQYCSKCAENGIDTDMIETYLEKMFGNTTVN